MVKPLQGNHPSYFDRYINFMPAPMIGTTGFKAQLPSVITEFFNSITEENRYVHKRTG